MMREVVRAATFGAKGLPSASTHSQSADEILHERIKRKPLSPRHATAVALSIAQGLEHAHARGIVHRDLKPRNVYLEAGSLERAKILDFGIALSRTGTVVATGSEVVGTPGFMAPEQARSEDDVDARADVFSLGCVLFHAMTGTPPFTGGDLMAALAKLLFEEPPRLDEVVSATPDELADLCQDMLSKDREGRPATMKEVRQRLQTVDFGTEHGGTRTSFTRPPALTLSERAPVAVVLAVPAEGAAIDDAVIEGAAAAVQALFGARLERPKSGGIVAVISSDASATDEALSAVRCAEHLRSRLEGWSFAAALGRGVVTGGLPLGNVIDLASRALRPTPPGAIGLDETCAALAERHYELEGGDDVPVIAAGASETDRIFALTQRARVRLTRGEFAGALEDASSAVATLDALGGIDEGELALRLILAEALIAVRRKTEAAFAIRFANERLDRTLSAISDPELREACASRVPEHARLRSLMARLEG
jgi:hypothetical protein